MKTPTEETARAGQAAQSKYAGCTDERIAQMLASYAYGKPDADLSDDLNECLAQLLAACYRRMEKESPKNTWEIAGFWGVLWMRYSGHNDREAVRASISRVVVAAQIYKEDIEERAFQIVTGGQS